MIEVEDRAGRDAARPAGACRIGSPDGLARRGHPDRGAAARRELGDRRGLHRGAWPACRRGARRRRAGGMAPVLQPGARLSLEWSARLEEHIGTFRVDPIGSRIAAIIADRAALAALGVGNGADRGGACRSATRIPSSTRRTRDLVDALGSAGDWPARYAAWELALLAELGFGLDLAACAVTGAAEDLVWVSPKSGRAVSRAAGAAWADRLLPLPGFLRDGWMLPPHGSRGVLARWRSPASSSRRGSRPGCRAGRCRRRGPGRSRRSGGSADQGAGAP